MLITKLFAIRIQLNCDSITLAVAAAVVEVTTNSVFPALQLTPIIVTGKNCVFNK